MNIEEVIEEELEELEQLKADKETLERQIAFRKDRISKLEPRLQDLAEANSDNSGSTQAEKALLDELGSDKRALATLENGHSEILRRIEFLKEKVGKVAEDPKEFEFGWRSVETTDLRGGEGTRKPGGSELQALEVIAERGGETSMQAVSQALRIEYDYARLLCTSLGKADYIDITPSGRCKITPKGEKALAASAKQGTRSGYSKKKEREKKWKAMSLDY